MEKKLQQSCCAESLLRRTCQVLTILRELQGRMEQGTLLIMQILMRILGIGHGVLAVG
jgi:hypothetical protein